MMNTTLTQPPTSNRRSAVDEPCDAELVQRIVTLLANRLGVATIKQVHVDANGGVVTLYGWLPSRRECALCCSYVSHTAGVLRVVDALQVDLPQTAAKDRRRTGGAAKH